MLGSKPQTPFDFSTAEPWRIQVGSPLRDREAVLRDSAVRLLEAIALDPANENAKQNLMAVRDLARSMGIVL